MALKDTIESRYVAAQLGIGRHLWMRVNFRVPGFPEPVNPGGRPKLYQRSAIAAWLAEHPDPLTVFKEVDRQVRNNELNTSSRFNTLLVQFNRGAFLPPAQQQALAFKKLVARQTQPQTTRIQLIPDWMQDD